MAQTLDEVSRILFLWRMEKTPELWWVELAVTLELASVFSVPKITTDRKLAMLQAQVITII